MRLQFLGCSVCLVAYALPDALSDAVWEGEGTDADGVAVSLLQVNAHRSDKVDETFESLDLLGYADETEPGDFCEIGFRGGRACCGARCGSCGGQGCQNRPGGAACCSTQVQTRNRRCTGPRDTNCMIPRQARPTRSPSIDDERTVEQMQICNSRFGQTLDLAAGSVSHSNLGGAGPDGGAETLVYGGVFNAHGEVIDLVISATSPYTPNLLNANGGVLHNGLHGGFGVINTACDGSVDLLFSFVNQATGVEMEPPPFLFTWFDSDHGMAHESREAITVTGFSSYHITDLSSIDISEVGEGLGELALAEGEGAATFTSTMRGGKVDNPTSPLHLSRLQADRTLALLFSGKSSFSVTLSETGYANPQGRNFYFSGTSALVCPDDARCTSFTCPPNYTRRMDAEFRTCAAEPCAEVDIENCCYEDA